LDVLAVRLGLGQPDDEAVAEGAGAEDLGDERADDEADVQESVFVSSSFPAKDRGKPDGKLLHPP